MIVFSMPRLYYSVRKRKLPSNSLPSDKEVMYYANLFVQSILTESDRLLSPLRGNVIYAKVVLSIYDIEADIRSFASRIRMIGQLLLSVGKLSLEERYLLNGLTDDLTSSLQQIVVLLRRLPFTDETIEIDIL